MHSCGVTGIGIDVEAVHCGRWPARDPGPAIGSCCSSPTCPGLPRLREGLGGGGVGQGELDLHLGRVIVNADGPLDKSASIPERIAVSTSSPRASWMAR